MKRVVIKRDGVREVDYDRSKIVLAISKALSATNQPESLAEEITNDVEHNMYKIEASDHNEVRTAEQTKLMTAERSETIETQNYRRLASPVEDYDQREYGVISDGSIAKIHLENIQDLVEDALITARLTKTAKAYIRYRDYKQRIRVNRRNENVKQLIDESIKYFNDPYNYFIYLRTYARWKEQESRRETWIETVDRFMNYMTIQLENRLDKLDTKEIREAILSHKVMPSMRLLQFAGPAVDRCNVCAYNCSFVSVEQLNDLVDIMYICMSGTGVGFSIEQVYQLPRIKPQTGKREPIFTVNDSKEGWCDSLRIALDTWYLGKDIDFDYSLLRPAGARLKTMGGRSSGKGPLVELHIFLRDKILSNQGKKLSTIDVYDIICKIGQIVVVGGVRRSAMLSLSGLHDMDMRAAKSGEFYIKHGYRSMTNNSVAYTSKPSQRDLMIEMGSMIEGGSGERGIFNRGDLCRTIPERRRKYFQGYLDANGNVVKNVGTNPCGEIILRSRQFCNLTEVVIRGTDIRESLLEKIKLATILGTYQSTLTDFKYISPEWKKACEEERLLGVSLTGVYDNIGLLTDDLLEEMRNMAIETNIKYAKKFGINQSTAITCVKPSGTVSQMVGCASGMHPYPADQYIRRVRISATDPLLSMMKNQGVKCCPEFGQTEENATTFVLEFPIKSPKGSVSAGKVTAIDQLELWRRLKVHYCEHNPSATIYVGNDEWIDVINWIDKNWNIVGGLTFFPRTDHVYPLAPQEEISEEVYLGLKKIQKEVDFSQLLKYERDDHTEVKRELACSGGNCEYYV